jgi:flagellar hook assembly protein FlgD
LDPNVSVVFSAPPANIDVTFADGPGRYQLEVVDGSGNSLEAIFDQRVVMEGDTWVEWDGRDAKGRDVPPGQYYVILYKDGKALKSISLVRTPSNP